MMGTGTAAEPSRVAVVTRVPVASVVVGFLLVQSLLSCTPEGSPKGGSQATGGTSGHPDAGLTGGSTGAAHGLDGGSHDAGGDSQVGTKPNGYKLAIPTGWYDDHLPVPPLFAPSLPLRGSETTREPPGMYDPLSDQFFSYAVLWWLDGEPTLDVDNLRSALATYYQGLCGAASVTLAETPTNPMAAARAPKAAFSGTLETGTCFNRPTPIARLEVTTYDCPNHPTALTLISSHPPTSAISLELAALRDGFDCY